MAKTLTREVVEGWLDDAGLTYEPFDLDPDSGYEWAITVTGQPFRTLVAHRAVDFNSLYLQVGVDVSAEHRAALVAMGEQSRKLFVLDLGLVLSRLPVGNWIHLEDPEESQIPKQVGVALNIFEEPAQRSGFLRRNHQVQSGARTVALMFQKMALLGSWP